MSTNGKTGVEAVRPQKGGIIFLHESVTYFYIVYLLVIGFHICLRIFIFSLIFISSLYISLFVNIFLYIVKDIEVLRPCPQNGMKC